MDRFLDGTMQILAPYLCFNCPSCKERMEETVVDLSYKGVKFIENIKYCADCGISYDELNNYMYYNTKLFYSGSYQECYAAWKLKAFI